jgi:hypothetical protein
MPKQIIDGKPYQGDRRRDRDSQEAEAIMYLSGRLESANNGHAAWLTAHVTFTDKNCADWEVNNHADWIIENIRPGVVVTDLRKHAHNRGGS